jgi:glycosyltransferase involved in cell wall biosynthesis
MIRLSIIIPVYNVERYISKCFHSIIDSNSLDNVEIICVDDGSQDKSGEICDEFAKRYRQIQVIHQKNRGVAVARNIGLAVARGEYIAWVDGDDYVEKSWLNFILGTLKAQKPDLLVFDYFEETNSQMIVKYMPFKEGIVDKKKYIYELSREINVHSFLWQYVIRSSFYTPECFDSTNISQEDYDCLTTLIPKLEYIYYLKGPLYHYIQREGSLVHSDASKERLLSAIQIAKRRYQYFEKCGFKVSKTAYWRSLISDYSLLFYKYHSDLEVQRISLEINKCFWIMLASSDLTYFIKIKLLLIRLLSPSLYHVVYQIFKSRK